MGPTNVALVKLYQAEQKLRAAQGRLDATTKNVRIQERRVKDLSDRIHTSSAQLKEKQASAGALDLDLQSRDAHIEKLRSQQQQVTTNKEYQAFSMEIKIEKVDRDKVEEEAIKLLEQNEKHDAELKELSTQLEAETSRLATMQSEIVGRTAEIQKEIDALKPERAAAAAAVPAKAREAFERLADRFEGEAMSSIAKPDRRLEEYCCTACNLDLVRDVYNRLHTRDELVFCPSCRRILFIPDDLPPELAVNKPKERKEKTVKAPPAGTNRQTSAVDVLHSIEVETEESSDVESTESEPMDVTSQEASASEEPPATHE